jgi:hypothetical protein
LGGSAFVTGVKTQDYALTGYGVAVSYGDRVELSLARQDFDTKSNLAPLSPTFEGLKLKQNIFGAKVRVAGDAVLDSDTWMPQIAVGLEYKKLEAGALAGTLQSLGAKDNGVDVYVSATKLFLAQGILVNGTLRATKANQNGLVGFGSTEHNSYKLMPEVSLAYLFRKDLAVGVEYRFKPDNLNPSPFADGLKEDDWADVFIAWAPAKYFSLTLAYVDLGHIVPALVPKRQTGTYLSAQIAF